jgi:non-ribosomal peptide synthetase component E (peptide arylation enzyme)
MPDERLGERICAFIVLRAGLEELGVGALSEYLLDKGVSKYKLPERIEYVDELPRTASGKVRKTELRMWLES